MTKNYVMRPTTMTDAMNRFFGGARPPYRMQYRREQTLVSIKPEGVDACRSPIGRRVIFNPPVPGAFGKAGTAPRVSPSMAA